MGEGEGGMFQENIIETCILSRVKQITRDRVEREVGGGIGMGNTCKPMADSFQCMTKSTTIKKVIIKKKIQKTKKKKKKKNDTMDQLDLIDIYRTFHPKTINFTFFSSAPSSE